MTSVLVIVVISVIVEFRERVKELLCFRPCLMPSFPAKYVENEKTRFGTSLRRVVLREVESWKPDGRLWGCSAM